MQGKGALLMSVTIKMFLLVVYVASPAVAVFFLGYGGFERLVGIFFQLFILSLVVLLLYDGYLLVRCIRAGIHREVSPSLLRFVLITCVFLIFASLAPVLSKPLRRCGAATRLNALGGESFRAQLLGDASILMASTGNEVAFLPYEQMPESFRRIDGVSARVQSGAYAQVNIQTSGRPYATGWILLPEEASHLVNEVKVADSIYRY